MSSDAKRRNVLLITIDALRADHVGCFGYDRDTSPNIDRLAQEGILFKNAFSNGHNTSTSFPSVLSSTYPLEYKDCTSHYFKPLSKGRVMLSEILKKEGYATAAILSNFLLSRYYNYDRGFDDFEDFGIDKKQEKRAERDYSPLHKRRRELRKSIGRFIRKNKKLYKLVIDMRHAIRESAGKDRFPYQKADIVTERAVSWLEEQDKPFFLWLHYMDVHAPWVPPEKNLKRFRPSGMSKRDMFKLVEFAFGHCDSKDISGEILQVIYDLYDASLNYVDEKIEEVIDTLKRKGIYDDTLVIITSDHGDEFKEHGNFNHLPKFYDELIHIPMIMRIPGNSGITRECMVQQIDISPTILDYLGISAPKNYRGRSLIPSIESDYDGGISGVVGETLQERGRVAKFGEGKRRAYYRTLKWKYMWDEETGKCELYDLEKDPAESKNVADEMKELCKEFDNVLKEHMASEKSNRTEERERISGAIQSIRLSGKRI